MTEEIDYSIYYRRYHSGTKADLERSARNFQAWLSTHISPLPRDAKVLDFGCGFGGLVHYLSAHFDSVQGVDSSRQQVEVAKANGLPVSYVPQEMFEPWCEQNSLQFDCLFLFDVLEHVDVDDQIRFVRRLVRVLRPGGILFVKVPNANSLLAARWRYNDWTHRSSFTESSLEFVLRHAKIEEIQLLPDESSTRPRWPLLIRPSLAQFYMRSVGRALWRRYLIAELGDQAKDLMLGYNLFARGVMPK